MATAPLTFEPEVMRKGLRTWPYFCVKAVKVRVDLVSVREYERGPFVPIYFGPDSVEVARAILDRAPKVEIIPDPAPSTA